MLALSNQEYRLLIRGYLEAQFREWFCLKNKFFEKLEIRPSNFIDDLLYGVIPYLVRPFLRFIKSEIDEKEFKKEIEKSAQLAISLYAPPKDAADNQTFKERTEFLLLHVEKIFLDFESPTELKAILWDEYQIAQTKEIPLEDAFGKISNYNDLIRRRYMRKLPLLPNDSRDRYTIQAYAQKLERMLSMFSLERITKEFQISPTPEYVKKTACACQMAMELAIEERIERLLSSRAQ